MTKFITLLFVLFSLPLWGVELGRQPHRNFTHHEYLGHFQNWAIAQDSRGFIYVANNDGVLEYDGNSWNLIPINGAVTRCLDVDNQGRIWVGAQDEFGYLAPDSLGNLKFSSLRFLVKDKCESIGLVRQVYATKRGVVFSSNNCIIWVNGLEVNVVYPKTIFHRTYYVLDRVFSVQPNLGLTEIFRDSVKILPYGERFANTRIYSMLRFDEKRILIATQSDGFFLYNISTTDPNDYIVPFNVNDNNFFKNNWVYWGIELNNNRFAFATYRGGAAVIDSQGDVIQFIGKSQGIQDETVWHIAMDNQENLWLALNNGISYTAIKSPITYWGDHLGLQGVIQSVKKYNGSLYVSTNAGVYKLKDNGFERIKRVLDLSWDIVKVKSSDGKETILVATGNGIYSINGESGNLIGNGAVPTFHIYQSKYHKDILFLGLYNGLGVAQYRKGKWEYVGHFEGVSGRIWAVEEDMDRNIWFVARHTGIVKANTANPSSLKFEGYTLYDDIPYNPTFDEDTRLKCIEKSLKLFTPRGLYSFDLSSNSFIPDSSLGSHLANGKYGVKPFLTDELGYLWYEIYDKSYSRTIQRAKINKDGSFIILPAELNEIPRMIFSSVDSDEKGITWIAGADGLFQFDPSETMRSIKVPKTYIRQVAYGPNHLAFGGAFPKNCLDSYYSCIDEMQPDEHYMRIPFNVNRINFKFSSPTYGQEDKIKFSYILEGFDEQWSVWSTQQQKEYTNLPFGEYTFKVKSLSIFDVESSIASYSFEVLRPWYNTPLMYAVYSFVVILSIIVSVRLKTQMLKTSNLKLQRVVAERTSEIMHQQRDILMKNEELVQQKEEIESQRDELDLRNKQTKSSIEYALTIQQAILPSKATIDEHFENFIFFQPKDVVSGDFYWFAKIDRANGSQKVFTAVVDCTGHGVPGAFMSMIGSRLLSEIVNERRIYDPAIILSTLNKMLNKVLNQKTNESFDGMDVCLVSIEEITTKRYLVSFSGANRSLIYHRKDATAMNTIKGNRKSIGSILPDVDKVFENHLLDLVSGDTIFLFTDGYTDQNNQFGKKMSTARLSSLLLSNIDQPMNYIGKVAKNSFLSFKGEAPQRDDVTLIGIRLR
jgi:serine phosphatase RsbU (regulator of sigma subunit)